MGTTIFLGEPPAKIKQWIINHSEQPDPEDTSAWGQLVATLENCSASDFNLSTLTYTGSNATLTAFNAGSGTTVKYDITPSSGNSSTWINLGFNGSIPEYVKYRKAVGSGWKHVWVKSTNTDGILKSIASGDAVYVREYDSSKYDNTYTAVDGETISETTGSFAYGNNLTYSVPTSITTTKGTYEFCGYNLTLNSQALLMFDSLSTWYMCFDRESNSSSNARNIYQTSPLRHFMNDLSYDKAACYNSSYKLVDFPTLITRFSQEDGFMRNVMKTVNKTWVNSDLTSLASKLDDNGCTNDADKFWTLGMGSINCTGKTSSGTLYFQDANYDTSKFSGVWSTSKSVSSSYTEVVKYKMNTNGSTGSSANHWWLRSAVSSYSNGVGGVSSGGYVGNYRANYCYGCSPACLIG